MMRLARIVRDASDLDGSVRSLPTPCKIAQAPSNASQTVPVLLKSNASGVSTMTPSPHARHASVRERTDAQKGPVMKWIGGPVALRRRLDHSEATPATLGSPPTVYRPAGHARTATWQRATRACLSPVNHGCPNHRSALSFSNEHNRQKTTLRRGAEAVPSGGQHTESIEPEPCV